MLQEYDVSPNELVDFANGRKVKATTHIGSPTALQRQGPKPPPLPLLKPNATSSISLTLVATPKTISSTSAKENHTRKSTPKISDAIPSPSISLTTSTPKITSSKPSVAIPSTSYHLEELRSEVESDSSGNEDEEFIGSESSDDDSDEFVCQEDVFLDAASDDEADFEANVDPNVVDENLITKEGEYDIEDAFDVRVQNDDYESISGSDDNKVQRYPEFNPLVDFRNKICLKPGLRFGSNEVFREALRQYALENGFDYYYLHNDKSKVSAYCKNRCGCGLKHGRKKCVCKERLCGFKAVARKMGLDGSFQLKQLNPDHSCGWQDRNTKLSSSWVAKKYLEHYRDDPQWRIKAFIMTVKREHSVHITYHQAWRARVRAVLMTLGFAPEQYAKVWDYASILIKYNPGSSVYVRPAESIERPLKFERFYVCLKACKDGFLNGCRPLVGLDGSHLKGAYSGQVFSAVAMNGNENIFPVAYAVVEQENKVTWCWFIQLLLNDIGSTKALTFMSDRCKVCKSSSVFF